MRSAKPTRPERARARRRTNLSFRTLIVALPHVVWIRALSAHLSPDVHRSSREGTPNSEFNDQGTGPRAIRKRLKIESALKISEDKLLGTQRNMSMTGQIKSCKTPFRLELDQQAASMSKVGPRLFCGINAASLTVCLPPGHATMVGRSHYA